MRLLACALLIVCALPCRAQAPPPAPLEVTALQCRGNTATSCRFILSNVYLAVGDRIDEQELRNAWFRLSALPNFASVRITLERGQQRGTARVIVEVTERDPWAVEVVTTGRYLNEAGSIAVASRLSDQNLFGAGKILDLTLRGTLPVSGPRQEASGAELQYIDPHPFDARRYFLFAGFGYLDGHAEFGDTVFNDRDDFADTHVLAASVGFGRRLWDFSDVTATFQYRLDADNAYLYTQPSGRSRRGRDTAPHVWSIAYGLQTEDDSYFPTRGSRLRVSLQRVGSDSDLAVGYRHTWRSGSDAIWSVNLGRPPDSMYRSALEQDLPFSVAYARALSGPDSAATRGRWYVEIGAARVSHTNRFGYRSEVGIKAGWRFLSDSLGVIDLSLLGTTVIGWGGEGQ
jgi:outer membrane protein assembly factor BamA